MDNITPLKPVKHIIIFGASSGGRKTLSELEKDCSVLGFSDNNRNLWGKNFCGYPVISPEEIKDYSFDQVLIASGFWYEIYPQLLQMGLDREKVVVDYMEPPFRLPWGQYIFGILLLFVMIYYIFFN